ncbi:uncharacterized protein LOC115241343 [Formica exsecta]|uniref:uncharacterized protein LOC115241343 n=1 Tax=Formica exsecta TaxID=72781 RepID=UPI001143DD0C|nr:uncharacterized protein LOC115241343 [Formica exsecta]
MCDILRIGGEPIFDDRIVKIETHTYNPYANTTFGNSDEIRIPIQQQDLYTLPCDSFLYIEGRLESKESPSAQEEIASVTRLVNNCAAFMFEEIRYELDSVEIDRSRNVGITSTIKNYASLSVEKGKILKNAGWDLSTVTHSLINDFNFCVPLNVLLGFCEDYKRVVINARHELILIRARNDNNCIISRETQEPKIVLLKIQWRMPHIFPLLQSTTKHSWAVKAATQLEKPRYVIFALQSGKKNFLSEEPSLFDDYKLNNVKLYLNSDFYPYDDMNLDFDKRKVAVLFDMYSIFRRTYYGCDNDEAFLNLNKFLVYGPLVVIDCSRQNESIKSATVDVRIEVDCKEDIPSNTTAYCLIIHNRVVEYNPLTNVVRRIV